jgi:DeoR family transcriptional regulator, glycerol-3-phosphate regulon repressor
MTFQGLPVTNVELEPALNERQSRIVEQVEQQGFVTIDALARDFAVSAQTVRREIIRLDELGVIQRFHGGAGRRGSGERMSYELKQTQSADLKRRIGLAMAGVIEPGQAIFLDVGTTAEAVATAILGLERLTIVTPSGSVARILAANTALDVVITGGRVVGPDCSMVGPLALKAVEAYRFDWSIISCSGIDEAGAVLDFDADKIALKQTAMGLAGRKVLVADSTKFGRSALSLLARIEDFDLLVTDKPPPANVSRLLGRNGLHIAS